MGAPLEALRASDGVAPAVRATISSVRLPGDMDIITDSVANWPHKGIATSGTPDEEGVIIPDTVCVFEYVLSGTIIHITGFAPGYYDIGHTENQIVIIKPTTYHNDSIVELLEEGGASVTVGDTPPENPADGDLWGDTSDDGLNSIVVAVGSLLMPIGTIYSNKTDSTNPGVKFGFGNWVALPGRMVVGLDPTQPEFDTAGETGGQKTVGAHDHANRWRTFMPSGTGSLAINDRGGDAILISDNAAHGTNGENLSGDPKVGLPSGTGIGGVNNMNPYLVAYMWERVS